MYMNKNITCNILDFISFFFSLSTWNSLIIDTNLSQAEKLTRLGVMSKGIVEILNESHGEIALTFC